MNMPKQSFLNVSSSIETITPRTASSMLETSPGNRNLKPVKVRSLVRDMLSGGFALNGQSIIFDENGQLMDGHHRLTACIKADVPIESVVVYGVRRTNQKTQDTGSARSAGDHLTLAGHENGTHTAATINCLLSLKSGVPRSSNASATEIFRFIEDYPEIKDSVRRFPLGKGFGIGAVIAAIHFVANRNGEGLKAQQFGEVFAKGIPAYAGCPAHRLRERLTRELLSKKVTSLRDRQNLTCDAWVKFRSNIPTKTLKPSKSFSIPCWPE